MARRVQTLFQRWRRNAGVGGTGGITDEAEKFLYRQMEAECFPAEIDAIRDGKNLPKQSKIVGFKPFVDEKGILRAEGRATKFVNAEFENHPVTLDARHFATKLLIASYHRKYFHGSAEIVLNELRQKYYIVGLRRRLRSIVSRCLTCRLRRRKPQNPQMAELPVARLAYQQRPFTRCGVDYFEPIQVKIGRRREKR